VIGAATQPIVSRYGRHAVVWDNAKLSEVVTRLQSERQRHDIRVGADSAEGPAMNGTNNIANNTFMSKADDDVITEAERIKREATNGIAEIRP
jgi:hypothetical protein